MKWTKDHIKWIVTTQGNYSNQHLFSEINSTIKIIEQESNDKEKYWQQIYEIMDVWSNDFSGQTYPNLFIKLKEIVMSIQKDSQNKKIELEKHEKKEKLKKTISRNTIKVLIWLVGTIVSAVIVTLVGLAIGGKL